MSAEPNITMDWTATLLDAAGAGPAATHPLDGRSLLPWLVENDSYPEHDLYWRITSQSSLRRGRFKYVHDRRPRPVLGNWPLHDGDYDLLYDVTVDGREAADLSPHHPELVTELRAVVEAIDAQMVPYPPDLPGLPRRASAHGPAISQAD